jgi:xylulokinase
MYPIIDHPGASIGAAFLAGLGTGLIEGWDEVSGYVQLGAPVVPDSERQELYEERYHLWRELGDAVSPVSHQLATRGHESIESSPTDP